MGGGDLGGGEKVGVEQGTRGARKGAGYHWERKAWGSEAYSRQK